MQIQTSVYSLSYWDLSSLLKCDLNININISAWDKCFFPLISHTSSVDGSAGQYIILVQTEISSQQLDWLLWNFIHLHGPQRVNPTDRLTFYRSQSITPTRWTFSNMVQKISFTLGWNNDNLGEPLTFSWRHHQVSLFPTLWTKYLQN